jgi:hypothetical protein
MAALGGLRKPKRNSVNAGWRNLSFRGYADYMQTAEFSNTVDTLIDLAKSERPAHVRRGGSVALPSIVDC